MKAWIIDRYGGPLHLADMPVPAIGAGDVLVQVHAASVSTVDLLAV